MKQKLLMTLMLAVALVWGGKEMRGQVFITELADPNNNANVRYIELYNSGATSIDFTEGSGWRIDKYTNASATVSQTLALTGTIPAGGFYLIATGTDDGDFFTVYGVTANQFDGANDNVAGSNGDDNLEVYNGSGILIDQFGVPGEDGTNTNHEFEDGRAERKATVITGNTTYTFAEWNIWNDTGGAGTTNLPQNAPDDFDPGAWIGASTPTISLSESTLTGFTYESGNGPSPEQSFTAEGTNLTVDITITPPTDYEISTGTGGSFVATDPITLTQSGGTVGTTSIYVRLKSGLSAGDYNSEEIMASSTDATSQTVTCSGSVYEQIGWANLQWPGTGTIARYDDYNVYARVFALGVTDAVGQGAGITAWIGYSTSDTDPSTWTDWVAATYLGDVDVNNDEYIANLGANLSETGTYYYASRFQLGSAPYVYGGFNSGFWDGTTNVSGVLTVTALPQIDWANLQWPGSGSIDVGGSFNVYAQVYKLGITDAAGQGAGITAWIGYSTSNSDPSTWINWITASFGGDAGNNDEYTANISSTLPSGTYYYASRFQLGAADYIYGGYHLDAGGFWDGTTNVSGVLTVNVSGPTNHATNFSATANASNKITVSWTDAIPFVEGYLIKGSTIGYADIIDPVNGIEESDGLLVQNVSAGIESYQFTGLTELTTYYFKIYPYNGTGTEIIYKTDGSVPEANASTLAIPFVIINEVDSDTPLTDVAEFIELYDGGVGNTDLSGLIVVLFNGNGDISYDAIDLNGYSTDVNGYFVIGSTGMGTDIEKSPGSSGWLQNGADAVALYVGDLSDFPNGTPVTTLNLIDALVYDTNDSDDTGLLVLLNEDEPQVNEGEYASSDLFSMQRIPNGTGGQRNTSTYDMTLPTPDAENEFGNITWSGASSNDWHTIANWDFGVPTASTNVIIPANPTNYPTIASAASCNNLTIESSATGTGSLLGQSYLTVSGTTIIERYATANGWHGIAGPLDNDDFNSLYFGGSPNVWAMYYIEAEDDYEYVNDLNTDLGDAKGWMVWIGGATPQTFEFTGALRSSLIPLNLTHTDHPTKETGYNFVGNPYPSAIDWDAATGWTKTNVDGGIWIWNPAITNWSTYNVTGGTNLGTQYIPVGQGFFVQVNAASSTGTLGMTTEVQVHNNVAFMAPSSLPSNLIKLKLADGEKSDESIIQLNASATEGYDGQFDMHKMFSWNEEQPQIYSTANNFMAVNVLPEGTVSVPMDVRGVDGNEMTISLEAVSDFDHVYLSDDFTGVQTELTEQPYTFVYDASQTDRFTVYFTIVSTTENALDNIRVYSFDKQVRLEIPMQVNVNVEVVNMLGQTVRNMDAHMGTTDIHLDHGGYYLVKITGDNQRVTRKVFIR